MNNGFGTSSTDSFVLRSHQYSHATPGIPWISWINIFATKWGCIRPRRGTTTLRRWGGSRKNRTLQGSMAPLCSYFEVLASSCQKTYYPLVNVYSLLLKMDRNSWFTHEKMVMFHSYVNVYQRVSLKKPPSSLLVHFFGLACHWSRWRWRRWGFILLCFFLPGKGRHWKKTFDYWKKLRFTPTLHTGNKT